MKLEKQLLIIGIVAVIFTAVVYFTTGNTNKAGFSGTFNTIFELFLMAAMVFLVLAINFFAIRFVMRQLRAFFRK